MTRKIWIALVLSAVFAACSDDDNSSNNNTNQNTNNRVDAAVYEDAAQQADAAEQKDAAQQPDVMTTQDAGSDWTCEQIGNCANQCGTDINCVNECKSHGCASAQQAFGDLMSCVLQKCNMCITDPQSQECVNCRNTECQAETQACIDNTCP